MTSGLAALNYAALYFFTSSQFQLFAILLTLIILTIKLFALNRKHPLEKLRNRFLYNVVIIFNVLLLATIFNAMSNVFEVFSLLASMLYFLTSVILVYVFYKRRKMALKQFFN